MGSFCRFYKCNNNSKRKDGFCSSKCYEKYIEFVLPELSASFLLKLSKKNKDDKKAILKRASEANNHDLDLLIDYVMYKSWIYRLDFDSVTLEQKRDILSIYNMLEYKL